MDNLTESGEHNKEQLLLLLRWFLAVGWVIITLVFFFFVSSEFSDDTIVRAGATVGISILLLISDVVGYRAMSQNLRMMDESGTPTVHTPSNNNWMGPDGTESGPDVAEDWYLSYEGTAPVVEAIYDQNYGVDRGNGAIPIEFYLKKWGIPEGFGTTDAEKKIIEDNAIGGFW